MGMDYTQTGLSPQDMELLKNRRFQLEDIARFMGVPSVLINDLAGTTAWGSGIAQIMEGFYKLGLRPYLERIESSLKKILMDESEWQKIDIEFNFDSVLRADKKTRIETLSKGVNAGLYTPNEARLQEGLPPQDGGDVIFLNGSLQPAETLKKGDMNNEQ
jgi:HK97 family phage portal protein